MGGIIARHTVIDWQLVVAQARIMRDTMRAHLDVLPEPVREAYTKLDLSLRDLDNAASGRLVRKA